MKKNLLKTITSFFILILISYSCGDGDNNGYWYEKTDTRDYEATNPNQEAVVTISLYEVEEDNEYRKFIGYEFEFSIYNTKHDFDYDLYIKDGRHYIDIHIPEELRKYYSIKIIAYYNYADYRTE